MSSMALAAIVLALLIEVARAAMPQKVGRDECLLQVRDYLAKIQLDAETVARLEDARRYYNKEMVLGDCQIPMNHGCIALQRSLSGLRFAVPCFDDREIMGPSDRQDTKDVLEGNAHARLVWEAEFVCRTGHLAGKAMKDNDLFEAITGQTVRPSREQCLGQVQEHLARIPIDAETLSRVEEARQYYRKSVAPDYQVPASSEGCSALHRAFIELRSSVPCFDDREVMGISDRQNAKDVMSRSAHARRLWEAEFACRSGNLAGKAMRDSDLFEAITALSSKLTREQCLNEVQSYLAKIPLDATTIARLEDARQYYHREAGLNYVRPEMEAGCSTVCRMLNAIPKSVECYDDREIMGPSPIQDQNDVHQGSAHARLLLEVNFACYYGRRAGKELRNHFYKDILYGQAGREPPYDSTS